MRIGISTLPTERSTDVAVLASKAEELGFDSIWTPEQSVLPVHIESDTPRVWGDIVDPFVMLARASAVTRTLKGTAVSVVNHRNPLAMAKQVATLDMYSGGRFLFGIGVGGLKEEGEIMGADFPRRWTQGREAVEAMKVLWTTEASEYHGHYYDFPPVYCFPKPAQRPHPPIILGGRAPRVLKRVAEWGDGWIPIDVTPEQVREGRQALDDLARAAKRDPASIEISVLTPAERDAVERFFDAGADRVIVPVEADGEKESLDALERIAETVLR